MTARGEAEGVARGQGALALPGDGETGALVQSFDWAATPLGPIATWPTSLRTMVQALIASRFSMWMWWGPDLTMFYNDAYRRDTLGHKHPWALGRPAREVWAEIWPALEPRIRQVVETRTGTWDEALLLFLERSGYREETYHTFSYSPIADEEGEVAGMLCVVTEDTGRVVSERRMTTLRELAAALGAVSREEDVLSTVVRHVGANQHDLPFTLTYLYEGEADAPPTARLACATGITAGAAAAPLAIDVSDDRQPWPAAEALARPAAIVVDDLASRFGALPTGAWDVPPSRALVVPIASAGQERRAGFFVAALNPFRPLDDAYAGFVDLVTGQVASSLANARAYAAERRRAEQLAAIDRAKTQFFSNVSHEFRTPLTLLLGPTEDALADLATPDATRERLAIVHRNALRLLRLVNTLLDFSRIEAGRVTARFERTDLPAYTAELASSFRSAVERAGLQFVVDCPPAAAQAAAVYVDRDMWEKVVLNLVSNAFKHTFDGQIAVCVRVRPGEATLEVRDTGVGIPADQVSHVFERFHRVPNARSRTHEGSGIGLALVQELVRLHGGTVSVTSEVGAGTTFTVTVPTGAAHLSSPPYEATASADSIASGMRGTLGAAAFVEEAARWLPTAPDDLPIVDDASVAGGHGSVPMLAGARVLVADDNADMRNYVTRLLRERGFEVWAVADGGAALEAARANAPELVLSDVMMPGLDGFELLAALRADAATRAIPIILLSARAGEEARVEGMEAGADDYLVKPFSARELVARAEGHLRLARIRREAQQEQARLLAAVAAERTRLRDLIAQAPAAIAVLRGPAHVFETVNAAYSALVGDRELLGKPIRDALPDLEGQGIFELLDDVYRSDRTHVGEALPLTMRSADGEVDQRAFTFVYQPMRDDDGSVAGIFVLVVDVTVQERARREAVEAREEAESANRAKGDFLAAMSHELRTPLNAIGGYTELIELGIHGPVTEAQREALARIRRSEEHLLALINDVLNFAKLEAGRVDYEIGDVSLAQAVADVTPMIEPQFAAKGIAYVVRVDANAIVRADADKVRQILLNLLSNAIKFTERGGRVEIDTPSRDGQPAGHMYLRVTDTGIGIPLERREAIFSPFVQAHRNLTRTTEGTGLGLAISRDLARAMGGDLRVRSEEGRGSAFTLELPAAG